MTAPGSAYMSRVHVAPRGLMYARERQRVRAPAPLLHKVQRADRVHVRDVYAPPDNVYALHTHTFRCVHAYMSHPGTVGTPH